MRGMGRRFFVCFAVSQFLTEKKVSKKCRNGRAPPFLRCFFFSVLFCTPAVSCLYIVSLHRMYNILLCPSCGRRHLRSFFLYFLLLLRIIVEEEEIFLRINCPPEQLFFFFSLEKLYGKHSGLFLQDSSCFL